MEAQALVTHEDGSFTLESVILDEAGSDDVVVRTVCSGVSIGTEFALINGKLSWGPYPLVTGYQAAGIVEWAGKSVKYLKKGDRVFVRGNKSLSLKNGAKVSSVSGAHASYIICDADLGSLDAPGLVPEGVDMGTASMFVMPSVALHGVDMVSPSALETVAVYGVGQIGIGVVAVAALRGCRVIALDTSKKALELASIMGAEHTINCGDADWRRQFDEQAPEGADTVFEATGIPSCVDVAMSLVKRLPAHYIGGQGKFVYQGNYGSRALTYNFLPAHGRQVKCFYPCDDGKIPNRKRIMRLLYTGALKWEKTITHRLPYSEAPKTFEAIKNGDKDFIAVVFNWSKI